MPKQQPIVVEGTVLEALGSGLFRVEILTGQEIICHPSGKMRMHMINILPGDKVTVEMSIYDLSMGRIKSRTIPGKEK
jgi:translation initiation factor IF-1